MKTLVRSGFLLCLALIALILATPTPRTFGAKPAPPPPPPVVPVHYTIHYWQVPTGGTGYFNMMNNQGQAVGWYTLPDSSRHAWFYDPNINADLALDLNALGVVGVPDGWVIKSATGINDFGDISGYIEPANDSNVRLSCVISLHPDSTDPLAPPQLRIIPVPAGWTYSHAGDINNHGMVLGFMQRSPTTWGVYLYQTGLHGEPSDETAHDVGLDVNNVDPIQISDTFPAMFAGNLSDGTVFRYTDGTPLTNPVVQTFPSLNSSISYTQDTNAHGDFCGSTHFITTVKNKTTSTTVPFRVLDNAVQVLSTLGPADARRLNSRGDFLGGGTGPNIYLQGYGLSSLNDMVSGPTAELSAWKAAQSVGTSDLSDPNATGFGDVTGQITFSNGTKAHYTLTPVP